VLDASAVLAYLRQEPGASVVAGLLRGAKLSAVNLCEVLTKVHEVGGNVDLVHQVLDGVGVVRVPFADGHASAAAALREQTRAFGLSLGDRACLALGALERLPVVTSDQKWERAPVGVTVHLFR
jgi:PIN domain nuclease of toxin-antitoxin system